MRGEDGRRAHRDGDIPADNPNISYCPADRHDLRYRSNGEYVYLAGCAVGTGTVQLRRRSDGRLLNTYTFDIASSSAATRTPTPTASPTATFTPTYTPTATPTPAPCDIRRLGTLSGTISRSGRWSDDCSSVHRVAGTRATTRSA